MNRVGLANEIAKEMNLTKKLALEFVNTFEAIVVDELSNGNDINLSGFGKWYVNDCKERIGRNPKSGDEVMIKAHRSPKFKAGKWMKDEIK